ncbi:MULTISPECIES: glycerophosphodiester phosphodiesterase [unclassified Exiguobacterium]|uniref:glycerophosphodiester phosphodiesterase n=1 Tax=unclassified Exiguobacterium TaxID=2644629 RepID=UPI001BEADDAD|nr:MULTISPECIES: glycerophosphodiester phosphodiesterase [unclassified Exiguobacterium]
MLIYAHRGYSAKYPENTLSAFKAALPHVDGIELDVQLTRDGRLVVIHDETVDRTTNGSGFVKDMTLRQLRLLRTESGERIPTLEEVLVLLEPTDVTLNIELKTDRFDYDGIEYLTWLAVTEFKLEQRVVFSSFNPDTLIRLRDIAREARIAVLTTDGHPNLIEFVERIGAEAVHAQPEFMGTRDWMTLREQNRLLRLYTINDPSELPDMTGVDAIMTDEVERFQSRSHH